MEQIRKTMKKDIVFNEVKSVFKELKATGVAIEVTLFESFGDIQDIQIVIEGKINKKLVPKIQKLFKE